MNSENRIEQQKEQTDWEILGVQEGATLEEIKTAYREAAKKAHPDANKDRTSDDLKRIIDAYKRLSNVSRRQNSRETVPPGVVRRYEENRPDPNDPDSAVDLWE